MPKSRTRKGRKSFKGKPLMPTYSVPEPLALFSLIGRGTLDPEEEDAACGLLLASMGEYTDSGLAATFTERGLPWPPVTNDDIRTIGKALVEWEREEANDAVS